VLHQHLAIARAAVFQFRLVNHGKYELQSQWIVVLQLYAGPNPFPSPNAQFPRGQFNEEHHFDLTQTEEDPSQGTSSQPQSPMREPRHLSRESNYSEDILCKAMTLKVLSQSNKRDFTVLH
jgi:hypothetical protein